MAKRFALAQAHFQALRAQAHFQALRAQAHSGGRFAHGAVGIADFHPPAKFAI